MGCFPSYEKESPESKCTEVEDALRLQSFTCDQYKTAFIMKTIKYAELGERVCINDR